MSSCFYIVLNIAGIKCRLKEQTKHFITLQFLTTQANLFSNESGHLLLIFGRPLVNRRACGKGAGETAHTPERRGHTNRSATGVRETVRAPTTPTVTPQRLRHTSRRDEDRLTEAQWVWERQLEHRRHQQWHNNVYDAIYRLDVKVL